MDTVLRDNTHPSSHPSNDSLHTSSGVTADHSHIYSDKDTCAEPSDAGVEISLGPVPASSVERLPECGASPTTSDTTRFDE